MLPITDVAGQLDIRPDDLTLYGRYKAKVNLSVLEHTRPRGRLVLVSAITPTPAGEGKTTTTIGLGQAMRRRGRRVALALREPSLGPVFGVKGGGTGGGACQLVPMEDINLHFNGDFHAITSAHNLLAAMVDNHLHFRGSPALDARRVRWPRVLDMNDRALREVVLGLGGTGNGVPRQSGFDITAASEIMAILCLATGRDDLRRRIERILVGYTADGQPVTAADVKAPGAMMALLREAIVPNLVQSVEGTPAFVHGGPFANIAHGCNSILATRMALHHADWVFTEAGFGFDLGAEKFYDIKCRVAGLDTAAVVLVATVRALKMHGGVAKNVLAAPDPAAVERGLGNLEQHLAAVRAFGERPIVALNRFYADHPDEIAVVARYCAGAGVPFAESDHFMRGGEGALELAELVEAHAEPESVPYTPMYRLDEPLLAKLQQVARTIYGARDVVMSAQALKDLKEIERLGYGNLPVCVAKTQNSLSDDARRPGRPRDFEITVRGLQLNAGAGFIVVLTGDILRMPGLPERPQAEAIDLVGEEITGLR